MAGASSYQQELEWLSDYLDVACGKLSCDMKEQIPVLKTGNGMNVKGFTTVAKYIVQSSSQKKLCGINAAEKAAIGQWLEYRENNVDRSMQEKDLTTVLKEINSYLADKVYFVGHRLTLADILLYCGLYRIVKELSFNEKQTYLHVSRWFNNIQHQVTLPKLLSELTFQKNIIYSGSDY